MQKIKDYYKILKVDRNASLDDIKKAYYHLSKLYHPDIIHKETTKYRDIQVAYETLKDPIKKAIYDKQLEEGVYDDKTFTEDATYQNDEKKYQKSTTSSYNQKYYEDPTGEPIVNILDSFSEYKFENAISAIWNRNIFVLIGNTLLLFILTISTSINRIFKLFKKSILPNTIPSNKLLLYIYDGIQENTLGKFCIWFITLLSITLTKCVYYSILIIRWIISKFFKYIILPITILFSALLLAGSRRN